MYLEYIDKDKLIEDVRGAVRIRSVVEEPLPGMPFGEGPAKALNYALSLAEEMGFRTVNLDNKVGYAEFGEGEEMVAVLGHVDVVPEGDNWICDPFEGAMIDGKIYGRGAADDKGPIIGALHALDAVRKTGKTLHRRVRIIFGADEEVDCTDMERYQETEEIPVMAFTPDAEYPAIYGEKGILYYTLKKKVSGIVSVKGGEAVNQVPDTASITLKLGDKNVTFISRKGRTAHGSTPQLGVNAVDDLIDLLSEIPEFEEFDERLQAFIKFYKRYYWGDFYGKKTGLDASDDDMGRNSSNVGILFGNGDEIGMKVDFRYIPGCNGKEYMEKLQQLADENSLELEFFKERNALYIPKDSGLITVLQKVFKKHTGNDMKAVCMGGGTYAKCLPNTVAFGPLFPGEEDPIHQPNEYMTVDNLMKNVEIMADAIYEMANYKPLGEQE